MRERARRERAILRDRRRWGPHGAPVGGGLFHMPFTGYDLFIAAQYRGQLPPGRTAAWSFPAPFRMPPPYATLRRTRLRP